MSNRSVRLGALFLLYVGLASPAYAYLDGATGSIIVQSVIGAVGTWMVYSRMFAAKAKGALSGLFRKKQITPDSE
jgi:hypothetical protein